MKIEFSILVGLLMCVFNSNNFAQTATQSHAHIVTYKNFAQQKTKFGYYKTKKRTYKIEKIPPSEINYGELQIFPTKSNNLFPQSLALTSGRTSIGPYYKNATKCNGDIFAGTDRAEAKTHEVQSGRVRHFANFNNFYNSGLVVPDDQMLNHDPAVSNNPTSARVSEEEINITIDEAYIYGIYKEDDNDFHMIIGNGGTGSAMRLFNAEVSGLPGDVKDNLLIAARNIIKKHFGDITCSSGAFKPVSSPIPIKISGSIFFDVDHKAGVVGFGIYKPKTAWEIHPVTDIEFLDD